MKKIQKKLHMNTFNGIIKHMNTKKERLSNWESPSMFLCTVFLMVDMFIITWLIIDKKVEKQKAGLYFWTTQLFILNLTYFMICLEVEPLLMTNFWSFFPGFYYSLNLSRLELEIMFIVNFLLLFFNVLLSKQQ
jgi:hypothetical protein